MTKIEEVVKARALTKPRLYGWDAVYGPGANGVQDDAARTRGHPLRRQDQVQVNTALAALGREIASGLPGPDQVENAKPQPATPKRRGWPVPVLEALALLLLLGAVMALAPPTRPPQWKSSTTRSG